MDVFYYYVNVSWWNVDILRKHSVGGWFSEILRQYSIAGWFSEILHLSILSGVGFLKFSVNILSGVGFLKFSVSILFGFLKVDSRTTCVVSNSASLLVSSVREREGGRCDYTVCLMIVS